MNKANLIFFEGPERDHLLPLTYTKPCAKLRCGILELGEKWEKQLDLKASFHCSEYLQKKFPLKTGVQNLLINATYMPNAALLEAVKMLQSGEGLQTKGQWIALIIPEALIGRAEEWDTNIKIQSFSKDLTHIGRLWDLLHFNATEIEQDFLRITKNRTSEELPGNTILTGEPNYFIEQGAFIGAASINTSNGPVYIGKNAVLMEGSLIRGPFALGNASVIKMGSKIYGPVSIGPHCKAGGEINSSIMQGYSNKAHDGFLGHAVIGEWCNLGADTNNSNLKNNYTSVKMWDYALDHYESTGLTFCGLFMGDHSKSAINTMFNTGTSVGVSCNIFGSGFPPTLIPSFVWGGIQTNKAYHVEAAIKVAEKVMARRGIVMQEADKNILRHIFKITNKYRKN